MIGPPCCTPTRSSTRPQEQMVIVLITPSMFRPEGTWNWSERRPPARIPAGTSLYEEFTCGNPSLTLPCGDVQVQAGRAYVNTDCADSTVEAGFLPFEGFDDFAARAQNGFGIFAETSSQPTTVEVQQALPATGSSGGTSQESTTTEPRVIEGAQKVSKAKAKQKRKKAKKSKRIKERKLQRERLRQQAQDHD